MREPLGGIMQSALNLAREILQESNDNSAMNTPVIDRYIMLIYFQSQLLLNYVNDLLDMDQIKRGYY